MAAITTTTPTERLGAPIRVSALAWAAMAVALFLAYVVLQENGVLLNSWEVAHEFFHDGRHALGLPCH